MALISDMGSKVGNSPHTQLVSVKRDMYMKLFSKLLLVGLLCIPIGTAQADDKVCYTETECPKEVVKEDCTCVGKRGVKGENGSQGDRGTRGPRGPSGNDGAPGADGKDGEPGVNTVIVRYQYRGPNISVGYMGSAFVPQQEYAWAHGPSLRLISDLSNTKDLTLELGWAPFRDGAIMGRASITHWLDDSPGWGLGGGLFFQSIGMAEGRNRGDYVGLLGTVAYLHSWGSLDLRAEAGPSIGGGFYKADGDDGFVIGAVGSAGLSWGWN